MENAQFQRIESWLALVAEELYVARLDREAAAPTSDDHKTQLDPARRDSHIEQIFKLRKALSE
jgi:hypothetical protein